MKKANRTRKVDITPFSKKHKDYYLKCRESYMNVAEGAYRAGKSVLHILSFAEYLETCEDKVHLVSGYSSSSARLNVGDGNGYGLSYIFRGRCKSGKYEGNECLRIKTDTGEKVVLFIGGGNSNSYKSIQGQSFGSWLSVEVANLFIGNEQDKNFINMALSRLTQSKNARVWWDLNPTYALHDVYTKYIDAYKKQSEDGTFTGGYNYQAFTLFDNSSLTPNQVQLALNNFGDKDSVLYRRGILGERAVAEGVIYQQVASNSSNYVVTKDYLKNLRKYSISIGVDFGGNGSGHSFVATFTSHNFFEVVILANKYVPLGADANGVASLKEPFKDFILYVMSLDVGNITVVRADSAEQVLIQELRNALKEIKRQDIIVRNSIKNEIKTRIDCKTMLINAGRWHVLDSCLVETENIIRSTSLQVWNSKEGHEDERLDSGHDPNIDLADAEEYSWEDYIKQFIRL